MPTLDIIRWEKRERSVHEQTHAADKTETSRRELSAHGERISVSHKNRWTLERVKGATVLTAPKNHTIFSQGEAANAVFYIQAGMVKLTVVSPEGQEAVVAILEPGAFVGESCLGGQPLRTATATALEDSTLLRLDKDVMIRALHESPRSLSCFCPICWLTRCAFKRMWWINSSIPARSGSRGCCCYWPMWRTMASRRR